MVRRNKSEIHEENNVNNARARGNKLEEIAAKVNDSFQAVQATK